MLKLLVTLAVATAALYIVPGCSESSAQKKQQQSSNLSRAKEGDSVWIFVNHVKADRRNEFEKFLHETFFDAASKLPAAEQVVFKQTRILHPVGPEADGSYSYVFLMDPVLAGGEYDIETLLKRIYGDARGAEEARKMAEMVLGDQTGYILVQSRH